MNDEERLPRENAAESYLVAVPFVLPQYAAETLASGVAADDFVDPVNRAIWRSYQRQFSATGAVDAVLAAKETDSHGYLLNLKDQVSSGAFIAIEAGKVIEARRKRQLHAIAETAVHGALNGQAANDVARILAADLDDYRREAESRKPPFTAISAADFASGNYSLNFLVRDMLVESQPGIVAATKKGMKTSVLLDYAIAQSAGGHFLGFFPVAGKRRTLFCSGESGLATLQRNAHEICRKADYDLASLDEFVISTDLPKCGNGDNLESFRQFIADNGAEVVIVDPAYLCFPSADAGNLFAQGELLRSLNDIIAEQNATLLLCHHTKKLVADPYGQPELENIAWAGFQEYARQWWLLGRREAYEPGTGIHRLWLSVGGSAGHGNLFAVDIDEGTIEARKWAVTVQKASEAREKAEERKQGAKAADEAKRLEAERTAVCRLLAKHPDGATKTFLRDHAGVSSRRWPSVFAGMYEDGLIVDCEVTISNHKTPRPAFKLNTEAA